MTLQKHQDMQKNIEILIKFIKILDVILKKQDIENNLVVDAINDLYNDLKRALINSFKTQKQKL